MSIIWHLLGFIFLLYLTSFVVLAIVRIGTGLSIQRFGYLSLKRVAYALSDGTRLEIRDIRILIHRPSYARPTWVTLRCYGLKIIIDPTSKSQEVVTPSPRECDHPCEDEKGTKNSNSRQATELVDRSRGKWTRLVRLKEKLKLLHTKIEWLRFVDLEILNSTYSISRILSLHVSSCTLAVDTRYRTVERGRFFRHKVLSKAAEQPAEWTVILKSVLFAPAGRESKEVLDTCAVNVHGLLYKDMIGLRDTSISIKLGRVHIPFDEIHTCQRAYLQHVTESQNAFDSREAGAPSKVIADNDQTSGEEKSAHNSQHTMQPKSFLSSFISSVQEIQIACSFIGASTRFQSHNGSGMPVSLNFAMNEFGIDLFRLESKSPAHRMYFPHDEVAHQALLAAISISIILDVGQKPDRLVYIPMATITVKSTFPSQLLTCGLSDGSGKSSTSIASLVMTSPCLDLNISRMPLLLELLQKRDTKQSHSFHQLMAGISPSRLARSSIKISIQEPVVRIVLPVFNQQVSNLEDYDLLILSISSASLETETFPLTTASDRQILTSTLRISSHHLYYQTNSNRKLTFLLLDLIDTKIRVVANPRVLVYLSCSLDTFSVNLVSSEIVDGLRQILHQISRHWHSGMPPVSKGRNRLFILQRFPSWLSQLHFDFSRVSIEIAALDQNVSEYPSGVATQVETCALTYIAHKKADPEARPPAFRSSTNRLDRDVLSGEESFQQELDASDDISGRRITCQLSAFDCSLVQGSPQRSPEPLLSSPRIEVSATTSSDASGCSCDVAGSARAFVVLCSLSRVYAVCNASNVLRSLLSAVSRPTRPHQVPRRLGSSAASLHGYDSKANVSYHGKIGSLHIKVDTPQDPRMLLAVSGVEYRHPGRAPAVWKARLLQLCSETSLLCDVWSSVIFTKSIRIDVSRDRLDVQSDKRKLHSISISSTFSRFAVPHQLVVHRLIDNFTNMFKATQQLHARFTNGNKDEHQRDSIKLRIAPKISFRSKALFLELEDSLFDWKLGMTYRIGLSEQKQRLAREEAYRVKVKKIGSRNFQSASRHKHQKLSSLREGGEKALASNSVDGQNESSRSYSQERSRLANVDGRPVRRNAEALATLTDDARVNSGDAWSTLLEHNAINWRRRIDMGRRYQERVAGEIRKLFGGDVEARDRRAASETILTFPNHPPLLSAVIGDFHFSVDKPSFPTEHYPTFLASVGKGIPRNMVYSLLILTSLHISMGESRLTLRNYPLPLLHIPSVRKEQSQRLPSLSLNTDFVIAEEDHGDECMRYIDIQIVPPSNVEDLDSFEGLSVKIRRTTAPVKTYSNFDIAINTNKATSITWGTSYQPAIQDMMQIIENFTKARIDPAYSIGFWDKIRLVFHSRAKVAWVGGGDVHLGLKGVWSSSLS